MKGQKKIFSEERWKSNLIILEDISKVMKQCKGGT